MAHLDTSTRQPLISLITLNHNLTPVTCEFLESTKKLSYANYEILVVDNASSTDPSALFAERYPEVRLIRSEKNLGFTGGNNLGIAAARGEYLFIVNNDTEVTPDLLERLLEPFLDDPRIGMVCPKIRFFDSPETIQYAGYTAMNPYTGRNSAVGEGERDAGQHETPGYTYFAHGAAMLVRRDVVERVGALPELFFIYYEELDWSSQIRRAGFEIYYQPSALIYHKESMTMGRESATKAYYHTRNRILFMRRNVSRFQFFVFLLFLIGAIIPKKLCGYLFRGQLSHIGAMTRGLLWNLSYGLHKRYS